MLAWFILSPKAGLIYFVILSERSESKDLMMLKIASHRESICPGWTCWFHFIIQVNILAGSGSPLMWGLCNRAMSQVPLHLLSRCAIRR